MSGEGPIAVLPMYDFAWVSAANDRLWAAVSARLTQAGVQAPARLTRGGDLAAQWRNPELVFGQTCGYPYVTALKDAVALIAAPEYSFPGCEGAAHRSFIIRGASDPRRDLREFRGATAALNAADSNTGMNLFRAAIAPVAGGAPFFGAVIDLRLARGEPRGGGGGPGRSRVDRLRQLRASPTRPPRTDRACGDRRGERALPKPAVHRVRPPRRRTVEAAREALFAALADPDLAEARATLGLKGARVARASDYNRVAEFERDAAALGYPRLA